MSRFGQLIDCIRSGQLSESQIAEELRDPEFAAFYRQMTHETKRQPGSPAGARPAQ